MTVHKSTSIDALNCWIISDGRRGIENQAIGLAEACSEIRPLEVTSHILKPGRAFQAASPLMQFALKSKPQDYGLPAILPDMAIGCGRQAIAALLAIKKTDAHCFTCYIQDPKIDTNRFDLVIAPEHDDLTGPNVETMIGSPNRVTRDRIIKETVLFEKRLNSLPMPRAAFLIGGPSKTFNFTQSDHAKHLEIIKSISQKGYSVLITTSRRTPDWAKADYLALSKTIPHSWYDTGEGDNPYFAFLGGAEIILCTADSTNMMVEICGTGKPVFTLPLSGNPRKFAKLYEALANRCGLKPYEGNPIAPDYLPLNETPRIAAQFWAHYERREAVLN